MERSVTAATDGDGQQVTEPQWVPSDKDVADARVTDFARFAAERSGGTFSDYRALWQWSVDRRL